MASPYVIAIAGPNGAGKTTIAETFLHELLGIRHYVNADTIARGLSQFEPQRVAVAAGRENLRRLQELAQSGETFAFETTLAGRVYAARIRGWKERGYRFVLVFFWMPDVELALERVAKRVASGGVYRPLADEWAMYDNSEDKPRLVAVGERDAIEMIVEPESWNKLKK